MCVSAVHNVYRGNGGLWKLPSSFVTSDKIKVVCTTFPQYDWVRQILGETVTIRVKLLTDNGVYAQLPAVHGGYCGSGFL